MTQKSNILQQSECVQLIQQQCKNGQLIDYSISPISESPAGYMGSHLRLTCEYKLNNEVKTIKFFIKNRIVDLNGTAMATMSEESNAFEHEAQFFKLLGKEPIEVTWAPKLFMYKQPNMLIFEDLGEKQFQMVKEFDLPHCKCAVKSIAQLHAFSFYLQTKCDILDEHAELFENQLFKEGSTVWKNLVRIREECVKFLLVQSLVPNKSEFLTRWVETSKNLNDFKPSKDKYSVICHGDLWGNNFMFKYDKLSQPSKCCLVDFQLIRFMPPTQDLLFFIFTNTDLSFRDLHLRELLDLYYEEIFLELVRLGLQPENVFPKNVFRDLCKKQMLSALVTSLSYKMLLVMDRKLFNSIMADKEKSVDLIFGDRVKFVKLAYETDENYRKVMDEEFYLLYNVLCD